MKRCPECRRDYYDDTLLYCLDDGSLLLLGPVESVPLTPKHGAEELRATLILPNANVDGSGSPQTDSSGIEQTIRYCTTSDGVNIAYSVTGSGPALVRVLGHFTHLEKEWEWPEFRLLWERLSEHFSVVRYDGRGIGLSEPYKGEFTEETRLADLTAVLKAASAENVSLLGISEGGWTAAAYSVEYPEMVDHLILYGSYSRGARARSRYDAEEDLAIETLIRKGWGRDTPAIRQILTSTFFRADADPKIVEHFNELQRISADGETAARYHRSCHSRGDGREMFSKVTAPTLVIHSQEDMAIPADEGRLLASIIPGAQLVLLTSYSHYFPTDSDSADRVVPAIVRFCFSSMLNSR
ncbi:MAG: alpha/beta hydrolase [Blastocatellia bacterium]|nr:alpha/beta hydrolase [Blastocatellia bacterium]